jgi:reverse transcriptase-like protein
MRHYAVTVAAVRDRIVQAAVKIVLEPVFEADFLPCSFGFRPRRSAHDALQVLIDEAWQGRRWVVETDIANCFSAIPRDKLMQAVEERISDQGVLVGWAARRGPGEPRPFPGSLPPNPAGGFHRTGLSSDLCRVRDRVRVDPVMARRADDERLAPHLCHEGGPRGLSRSWFPELVEAGDLVDCHRGAGLA